VELKKLNKEGVHVDKLEKSAIDKFEKHPLEEEVQRLN